MISRQTQGDNRQRRRAAKDAKDQGVAPSQARATSGASRQPRHRRAGAPHEERVDVRGGKLPSAGPGGPHLRPASGRPEQEPR